MTLLNTTLRVMSTPVKILAVVIFLGVFVLTFYGYLINIDPLENTSLGSILKEGLQIEALDNNNKTIFDLSSTPSQNVAINALPKNILNSLLAINYILDGSKQECAPDPKNNMQVSRKCSFSYANIITNNYILTSLINKINQNKGGLLSGYHDLFYRFSKYIAINWLYKNFNQQAFLAFLLNYSYYDNNAIGLLSAAYVYFGINDLSKLNLSQTIFLAEKVFRNNKYIYDSQYYPLINKSSILTAMNSLNFITYKEMQTALNEPKIQEDKTNQEQSTLYQAFANKMVMEALPNIIKTNHLKIYSTLNSNLQNATYAGVSNFIQNNNIPSASLLITNNGKILTGFTVSTLKNKNTFFEAYPQVKVSSLMRPYLYLTLLSNKINVPGSLLNTEIQNVIEEQLLAPSNLNTKLFPIFAKNLVNNGSTPVNSKSKQDFLNNTALNKAAMELVSLENGLFAKIPNAAYKNLANYSDIPEKSWQVNKGNISVTTGLSNLINSYAVLNQQGKYIAPIFINKIDTTNYNNLKITQTPYSEYNLSYVRSKVFREVSSTLNPTYKVIYDHNVAIALFDGYTIGIWLGDINKNADSNYTTNNYRLLEQIIDNIVGILYSLNTESAASSNTITTPTETKN